MNLLRTIWRRIVAAPDPAGSHKSLWDKRDLRGQPVHRACAARRAGVMGEIIVGINLSEILDGWTPNGRPAEVADILRVLRDCELAVTATIAEQINQQYRIPEPGMWSVVKGSIEGTGKTYLVRTLDGGWRDTVFGLGLYDWEAIGTPELVHDAGRS